MAERLFRGLIVLALLFALLSETGIAQIRKEGPEFQVNTRATYLQGQPRVEANEPKSFLVAWLGDNPVVGQFYGIRAQLFDRDNGPVGSEFLVSKFATNNRGPEQYPAVSRIGDDGFVVVWESYYFGGESDIGAQRVSSDGSVVGTEVSVNTSGREQKRPSVAANGAGEFVVSWIDKPDLQNYAPRVRVRKFDAQGLATTSEFGVTANGGRSRDTSVAMQGDGTFIVVWQEDGAGIVAQRFDSSSDSLGPVFPIAVSGDRRPEVAVVESTGDFVVVWQTYGGDGSGYGIFGRRFANSGVPASAEFQVNTYVADQQTNPSIATNNVGDFVVLWESYADPFSLVGGQDGSGRGIFGQYFAATGQRLGREFQVNTYTAGNQGGRRLREADVAMWNNGSFAAVWTSPNQDGDSDGVFAQTFSVHPAEGVFCGDAANSDLRHSTRDALAVLRASLNLHTCELCLCDTDSSLSITAGDALAVLRKAVGIAGQLTCPACSEN
jgi:hypothetical protein